MTITRLTRTRQLLSIVALAVFATAACNRGDEASSEVEEPADDHYVVDIVAFDHAFGSPDEVPSGWLTFRLENRRDQEVHEISVARMPEGITYEQYREEYIGGWETIWDLMRAGEVERGSSLRDAAAVHLPEWHRDVEYVMARNLLSSGRTAEATAHLEPGIYSLECWVKNAAGDIHISHGMIRELTVTEEDSGASRPTADVQIDLGSDGIVMRDPLGRGKQTVVLQLEEDGDGSPVHNDVHLIRMTDDTDLAEVAAWMEWYDVDRGLRDPAPADFLGGFHAYGTMPPEGRAWFTLDVDQPGRYAWIVQADPEDELWKLVDVD